MQISRSAQLSSAQLEGNLQFLTFIQKKWGEKSCQTCSTLKASIDQLYFSARPLASDHWPTSRKIANGTNVDPRKCSFLIYLWHAILHCVLFVERRKNVSRGLLHYFVLVCFGLMALRRLLLTSASCMHSLPGHLNHLQLFSAGAS